MSTTPVPTAAAAPTSLATAGATTGELPHAPRRSLRKLFRRMKPLHMVAVGILLLIVLSAILAPLIAPHNPTKSDLLARLTPPAWISGGDTGHLLGTDQLGRDILSRLMYGSRYSLTIAIIGTVCGVVIGAAFGMVAGFARGIIDQIVMLIVDAFISLPFIIVALAMVAVLGSSFPVLILLAVLSGFAAYTRVTRGLTLQIARQQYVLAAQSIGASRGRLLIRHILPNVTAPLIVLTTMEMGSIILMEAALSFLGFGIQPPTPAWGLMVNEGREYLHNAWWVGVFPGVAIMLLATCISLLGDLLRDILDPGTR